MSTPLPDSYALATDAQALIGRLLMKHPQDLDHLRDARIVCVFSQPTPMLRGHPCEAFIGPAKVQGVFRPFVEFLFTQFCGPVLDGYEPEFFVMIDAALWPTLDAVQRERLMFHELLHLRTKENPETGEPRLHEDGRPQLQTVPHDHELFTREIELYAGAIPDRLEPLAQALIEGNNRAQAKKSDEQLGRRRKRAG